MRAQLRASAFCFSLMLVAAAAANADALAGRWEGLAQIPGEPVSLVLDLDRERAGQLIGSITAVGFGAKGVPLQEISANNGGITASIALFGGAKLDLQPKGDALVGTLDAGGHTAALELKRTGDAQVDLPPRNTPLTAAFAGEWSADIDGGAKVHAELTLQNEAGGTSRGEIGFGPKSNAPKKLTRITQQGETLSFTVEGTGLEYEGRLDVPANAIQGHFYVGSRALSVVRFERGAKRTGGKD